MRCASHELDQWLNQQIEGFSSSLCQHDSPKSGKVSTTALNPSHTMLHDIVAIDNYYLDYSGVLREEEGPLAVACRECQLGGVAPHLDHH